MRRVAQVVQHLEPVAVQVEASSSSRATPLFENQVVIVTGSGQGIGKEAAKLFALHGAAVVVSDLDAAKSDEVAKEINAAGGKAISFPGDVTNEAFPEAILSKATQTFGKINHVVANAGYTWDGVIHKMTDKQWSAMIDVHLTAVFRMVRACSTYMRDPAKAVLEKGGIPEDRSIICISSTSARGNAGQINYAAAKGGVASLSKTVAKEWGMFNIRSNTVAFGRITTRLTADKKEGAVMALSSGEKIALGIPGAGNANFDMIPLKRPGTPQEAAGAVVMLASPLAGYVTGQVLEVTGGI